MNLFREKITENLCAFLREMDNEEEKIYKEEEKIIKDCKKVSISLFDCESISIFSFCCYFGYPGIILGGIAGLIPYFSQDLFHKFTVEKIKFDINTERERRLYEKIQCLKNQKRSTEDFSQFSIAIQYLEEILEARAQKIRNDIIESRKFRKNLLENRILYEKATFTDVREYLELSFS